MKTEDLKERKEIEEVLRLSDQFAQREGRRPRIMIAEPKTFTLKSYARENGGKYADLGFDVDIPPPYEKIKDIFIQAIESDVHVLSISIQNSRNWAIEFINEIQTIDNIDFKLLFRSEISELDYISLLKINHVVFFQKSKTAVEIAREILEYL